VVGKAAGSHVTEVASRSMDVVAIAMEYNTVFMTPLIYGLGGGCQGKKFTVHGLLFKVKPDFLQGMDLLLDGLGSP
jgi:hypothetical protein